MPVVFYFIAGFIAILSSGMSNIVEEPFFCNISLQETALDDIVSFIMDRKDYITDNLINYRDRLKNIDPAAIDNLDRKEERAERKRSDRRAAEVDRLRQDLSGRIARDLGALEGELNRLDSRAAALREIAEAMRNRAAELAKLEPEQGEKEFSAAVNELRIAHYRDGGKLDALNQDAAGAHHRHSADKIRLRELALKGAAALWLPALAMIAAGGIVALTLALLFL